ncbi:MAG: NAD-dependent deacylase, partial [Flammeovirgaceae bacterium]|nr:NAD-dependent deacylase [Flammeovirgaceae bacterium]
SDGLWEGHDVMQVATYEGWRKDKNLVLNFYNERRKAALNAKPNEGHLILAKLQEFFDVTIVTQNVDNLHERAGSKKVIHLHGELFKSRSTVDESLIYDINGSDLKLGDQCEKGSQLRPHIVWFGESVPMMDTAIEEAINAEVFIVVGTSLLVYPAAGLVDYTQDSTLKYIVDPKMPELGRKYPNLHCIEEIGSIGLKMVSEEITSQYA